MRTFERKFEAREIEGGFEIVSTVWVDGQPAVTVDEPLRVHRALPGFDAESAQRVVDSMQQQYDALRAVLRR